MAENPTPASDAVLAATAPSVLYAKIYEKNKAYMGKRKVDDPPQATFNYGDGKWVIQFHYIKDDKQAEKGGGTAAVVNPQDSKKKKETVNAPNK